MGTLYENIISLCQERGITGGRMCVDLKLSKGLMTKLKDNPQKTITAETAQKIADYFGVSVDRVVGNESIVDNGSNLTEIQKEAQELIMSFSEEKLREFIKYGKYIKDSGV